MSDTANITLDTSEWDTTAPGEGESYGRALKRSLIVHLALGTLVLAKSLIFPSQSKPYVPTLRVDMVALPDVLKKDLKDIPLNTGAKEIADALKSAEQDAKKIKAIKLPDTPKEATDAADPDELVLKPKHAKDAAKETTKETEHKPAKRQKSMSRALDRIKSLAKIEADTESDAPSAPVIVKGNKVSKGASLSGDAKEAAEANYYDSLRTSLQENWELPVWIARQNLSAQVRIFIDSRGKVRRFSFMKNSGNAQFDSAIKETLEQSQPFPIPPEELTGSLLTDGVLIGFPL